MGAAAEKAGIPAVTIISPTFLELTKEAARAQGLPELAMAVIPQKVMTDPNEDPHPACEAVIEDIVHGFTRWNPEEAEAESSQAKPEPERLLVVEGGNYQDAVDRMNSIFLAQGWSDGLSLTPPTKERVDWLLTGTDLARDQVLTTRFGPRYGAITVENVAINAAMAGARPEYMPILLAVVDALATEEGLNLQHYFTQSGVAIAPVLIVNGPIAKELHVNSSHGILGPGWQANATIGRALSLLMINGAGEFPSPGGAPKGLSLPGRYTWCFAENEEESPWPPLHVEAGYDADVSTVTVMCGRGTHPIQMLPPLEAILNYIAHIVKGGTVKRYDVPWDQLLILSPATTKMLVKEGWSKQDLRNFVHEKARLTMAEVEAAGLFAGLGMGRQPPVADKGKLVPTYEKAENLVVVVAGGPDSGGGVFIPCMQRKVTGDIERYKPINWRKLLETANSRSTFCDSQQCY